MAEEEKTSGGSGETEWYLWLFGAVLVIGLLGQLSTNTMEFLGTDGVNQEVEYSAEISDQEFLNSDVSGISGASASQSGSFSLRDKLSDVNEGVSNWIVTFSIVESWPLYTLFSILLSGLALLVIIYSSIRYSWIMTKWNDEIGYENKSVGDIIREMFGLDTSKKADSLDSTESGLTVSEEINNEVIDSLDNQSTYVSSSTTIPPNAEWEHVEELIRSGSESDWRQAIIEADIMLDGLLQSLGYRGQTIAERLQSVDPADMETLELAWSAHKVRNRIAHDGQNFTLTQEVFLQTIAQFERVFKEYRLIDY